VKGAGLVIAFFVVLGCIWVPVSPVGIDAWKASAPFEVSAPQSQSSDVSGSGFGGYSLGGRVKEISGSWIVPAISPSSSSGNASTWIGVADSNGNFIQVGTIESNSAANTRSYFVFWSDTKLNYRAQYAGPAPPGSDIIAKMTKTSKGWKIAVFIDHLPNTTFQTHYGMRDTFVQSEWMQEDPVTALDAPIFSPYPTLGNVRFASLQVNQRRPRIGYDDAQVMVTPHAQWVPTPIYRDSFALTSPTPVEAQFLSDTSNLDASMNQFYFSVQDANGSLSTAQSENALLLSTTIESAQKTISSQTWPASASAGIGDLLTCYTSFVQDIGYVLRSSSPENFSGSLHTDLGSIALSNKLIATNIGLPPE
jgi:hypothetical protein